MSEGPGALAAAMAALGGLFVVAGATPALALRPFDFTDAGVASVGELEIELGPFGLLRPGGRNLAVAPALSLNLGLLSRWELVLEGRHVLALDGGDGARSRLVDTAAMVKGVVREGGLQGVPGPSVAVEVGALLPTVNDEPGVGAEGLAVMSLAGRAGVAHLNAAAAWNRAHETALALGLILEGPATWPVRPVGEALYEQVLGGDRLVAGLLGAIWGLNDQISLDGAGRVFRDAGVAGFEMRLGLTWKTQLWNGR